MSTAPTLEDITALRALVEEHLSGHAILPGHFDEYWAAQKNVEDALVAYHLAKPSQLYLRDGEQLVEPMTSDHERHCRWGHYSPTPCRKPVVQIRWRWHPDLNFSDTVQDGWRHADGTSLHDYPDDMGECYSSCEPIALCTDCGQEFLDSHCGVCHTNGSLEVTQEAYGDRTVCTTPGCTREESFSSIGD